MKTDKHPGQWKPGTSGNPAGRRPGSGEVAKLRAAIAENVPTIVEKLTAAALAGDVGAARLLLERVIPPLKASEEAVPLTLPDGTLTEQGKAVLASVASGDLAPGQGAALLASLGTLANLTETDELCRRIEALEAARDQSKGARHDAEHRAQVVGAGGSQRRALFRMRVSGAERPAGGRLCPHRPRRGLAEVLEALNELDEGDMTGGNH